MNEQEQMIMLAIVLAFGVSLISGLLVVPAIELQQAEARGCETGITHAGGGYVGLNASQGRCFGH